MEHAFKRISGLLVSLLLPITWIAQGHAGIEAAFPMPPGNEYVEECGSCHTAYAPGLLPARSWERMFNELERHFGDDASLDVATRDRLLTHVRQLAADAPSATPLMRRINGAIAPQDVPQRITLGGFFRYMHDEVPTYIWKRQKIGSPANCSACHTHAHEGRYPEADVKIPK